MSSNGNFLGNSITLRSETTGTPGVGDDASFSVERGDLPNAQIVWDESEARFKVAVPDTRLGMDSALYNILHTGSPLTDYPPDLRRIEEFPSSTDITNAAAGSALVINTQKDGYVLSQLHQIPNGGLDGRVLIKDSNNDYDVSWGDPAGTDSRLPTIQTRNVRQVLVVDSTGTNYTLGTPFNFMTINGSLVVQVRSNDLNVQNSWVGNFVFLDIATGDRQVSFPNTIGINGDMMLFRIRNSPSLRSLNLRVHALDELNPTSQNLQSVTLNPTLNAAMVVKISGYWRKFFGPVTL